MARGQTRRRFLTIAAAALVASPARAAEVQRWSGRALGASASMLLSGLAGAPAQAVFAAVEAELARLDAIFSLHRDGSEIMRLNRSGRLPNPSADLRRVLDLSGRLHAATGGRFDPTVQPVWLALAEGRDPAAALASVGWKHLRIAPDRIGFARPGMAITLNGIAQGHVTDRIAALLRARGLTDLVIDMGEIAALGVRPDGRGWQAGIARPDGALVRRVILRDRALATSAAAGTPIGPDGATGHIVSPQTARPAPLARMAAVSAAAAAVADGLSTALCLMEPLEAGQAVAAFPGARIEWLA